MASGTSSTKKRGPLEKHVLTAPQQRSSECLHDLDNDQVKAGDSTALFKESAFLGIKGSSVINQLNRALPLSSSVDRKNRAIDDRLLEKKRDPEETHWWLASVTR